jgi:UDP-glucuronate 4-epimerase
VKLMDFIEALEVELSIQAKKNYLGMQQGDVEATWADTQLLQTLTGFVPNTPVSEGIAQFTNWFTNYYSSGE